MLVTYLKMPSPLIILSGFYAILAAIYIVSYWHDGYWRGMFKGLKRLALTHFKLLSWIVFSILLLILLVDKPITQLCQAYYNQNFYTLVNFICSMAEGWFIGGAIFTFVLILDFFGKTQQAILLKISLMSLIFAGLINGIIKFIFNRQRPSIGLEPLNFFHFFISGAKSYSNLTYAYNSMPSGHTITTFAAITPLILYSKHKRYKILFLFLGILEGFSRVYTINHWLSDVCVSAILGSVIGYLGYKLNQYRLFK